MSNQIPINNFGEPIQSGLSSGLSKPKADQLYLNVYGGDAMCSDLDMSGFQISNLDTPKTPDDAANKGYVDELSTLFRRKVSVLNRRINKLLRINATLAKKTFVSVQLANIRREIRREVNNLNSMLSLYTKKDYVDTQIQSITPVFKRYEFKFVANRTKMIANFNDI